MRYVGGKKAVVCNTKKHGGGTMMQIDQRKVWILLKNSKSKDEYLQTKRAEDRVFIWETQG